MKKAQIFLTLALILSGYAGTKYLVDKRINVRKLSEDVRYLPSPRTLRLLSFGFEPAMADATWIEAINYFGWQLGTKNRTYQYLPHYCDLILELDPLFQSFYEWAGTAFIYNALPIDRKAIIKSTQYVNLGIDRFSKFHRFDSGMILKGAFNYALEARNFLAAIPYYVLAARSFPGKRDMFLVASTYASYLHRADLSTDLKMEYLGNMAFEAQDREELLYVIRVLSSANFNQQSAAMIKSLRVRMEKDEDVRKLVESRLNEQSVYNREAQVNSPLSSNAKLDNILSVDFSKTWLPPELHVLLTM